MQWLIFVENAVRSSDVEITETFFCKFCGWNLVLLLWTDAFHS